MRTLLLSLAMTTLCLFSGTVFSSSIKQLDINELLSQSELAFEGQVSDITTRWNANKTDIFTDIIFRVDEVIFGDYSGQTMTLTFVGGSIDGATMTIEGSEMPSMDESGIYFVSSTTQQLVNPLVGWSQGHFLTKRDASGTKRMTTQAGEPVANMNPVKTKRRYFSEGVVTGVEIAKPGGSKAMTAVEFKQFIKQTFSKASAQ